MSARLGLSVGIAIAAVLFGGWKMLIPGSDGASKAITGSVSTLIDQTTKGMFVGAQATLATQLSETGSYAGARLTPPITLVRADATSYCIQLSKGPLLQHLDGPGGTTTPGAC